METSPLHTFGAEIFPLETSLVEWKRVVGKLGDGQYRTLETSLVEWKLGVHEVDHPTNIHLGNFLSGMETSIFDSPSAAQPALETSLVEWKPSAHPSSRTGAPALETSLVEWKLE